MQVVRSRDDHARAWPLAHHLAGRGRDARGDRRRNAGAHVPVSGGCRDAGRAIVAGRFDGGMANATRWSRPRGRRPGTPKERIAEGRDDERPGGIPEEERCAARRKRRHYRVLLARAAARRSRDAGGDHGGRGSAVPHAAVHRQLTVQEAGRQRGLGSDAVLGHVVAIRRSFTGIIVAASILAAAPASAQIELSGSWAARNHEDAMERGAGPYAVDYTGLPLNDDGRDKELSYSAAQ